MRNKFVHLNRIIITKDMTMEQFWKQLTQAVNVDPFEVAIDDILVNFQ